MKKVASSYKGKHFVIMDENLVDEIDSIDPYVDVEKTIAEHLASHVSDCDYYGIPAYIGDDQDLKDKIKKIKDLLTPHNV